MILSRLFSAFRKNRVFNPSLIEEEIKEKEETLRLELSSKLEEKISGLKRDLESSIDKMSFQIASNKAKLDDLDKSSKELDERKHLVFEEIYSLDKHIQGKRDEINRQFLEEEERIKSLKQELDHKRELLRLKDIEIHELEKIQESKKENLQRTTQDISNQIRIMEAKARPDQVWITAFTSGYEKAWETMQTLQLTGIEQVKKSIEKQAINETLKRLNGNSLSKD